MTVVWGVIFYLCSLFIFTGPLSLRARNALRQCISMCQSLGPGQARTTDSGIPLIPPIILRGAKKCKMWPRFFDPSHLRVTLLSKQKSTTNSDDDECRCAWRSSVHSLLRKWAINPPLLILLLLLDFIPR